jgi:pimeloyl-ACP methyl ester carboxylesterase
LYEPPFELPGITGGAPKDMLEQLKTMVAEDRRGDAVKYFMKVVGVPSFGIFLMTLFPIWKKLKAVAHTLPYDITIMDGFTLPEDRAKSIKVPTLITCGTKTSESIRKSAKYLSELVPGNQFKMLEGQTHNVSEKAIAPVLIEFFRL